MLYNCSCGITVAVPSLRQLVAGISPPRPGFDPRSVDVNIFGGQLTRDQIFRNVSRFSPVSITPPMLHTHLHLHVVFTKRTNERSLGTFQKQCIFGYGREFSRKLLLYFSVFRGFEIPPHLTKYPQGFVRNTFYVFEIKRFGIINLRTECSHVDAGCKQQLLYCAFECHVML